MNQRDHEWYMARTGIPTASRFKDVISKLKSGGETAVRREYRMQIVCEILTGLPQKSFSSAATDWGIEHESEARSAFEFATGLDVQEVGFIEHPTIRTGCSPDGFVGADAGVEIKCPFNTHNHVETLLNKQMPLQHIPQVQSSIWITGRDHWHFVSYDPRLPEHLRMFHQVIKRDDEYIAMLETEIVNFNKDVSDLVKQLSD